MCGLVGYLSRSRWDANTPVSEVLHTMADAIQHRGPDSAGYWSEYSGIALGHRRLAILDLSPAGLQPMHSECGRYVIVLNGEIYNHQNLRVQLESLPAAPNWKSHSDTETLLAGFSAWGIRNTVERCRGMFAFAVWDRLTHVLTMGRDRLGEKPLYYGWQGSGDKACFLFGSELKALKAHPAFSASINRNALSLFLQNACIAAPHTIYEGIYKLPPGHLLSVSLAQPAPALSRYWYFPDVARAGVASPFMGTDSDAIDELEFRLRESVGQQMLSDVPLGAFLSGGIDSSMIVALMQLQSSRPVKTFSIGFDHEGYNEAFHAKLVARHLGTDHTELYVSPQKALDVIPRLPNLYCEPFADISQLPTFLVAQLARQKVAVCLSGDGGDELFAGYNRYVMTQNFWGSLERVPPFLRRLAASGIRSISPELLSNALNPMQGLLPGTWRMANLGDKLHKVADVLGAKSVEELYLGLVTHWGAEEMVIRSDIPKSMFISLPTDLNGLNAVEKMMALDTMTYLADDILVKVDRAAMGVSLETRAPFLDHRVVEFAWSLPQHLKLRDGVGKWVLREVLYRHIPKALIDRPKMGFAVPIADWLRGPLRDWAESLLSEPRLRSEGIFEPSPIRRKWEEHLSGQRNWHRQLWNVLMFQAWLETHSD
jgi:asparagine synthase (glutamine-hydrolysing)